MSASVDHASLLFSELLELLRRQGFSIGVDHYVRLHALMDRVGGDCDPRQLRTLLCPIIASTASQQEQFYAAFEQLYGAYLTAHQDHPLPDEPVDVVGTPAAAAAAPAKRRFRWLIGATAAVVLLAGAGLGYRAWTRAHLPPPPPRVDSGGVVAPVAPVAPPAGENAAPSAAATTDSALRRNLLLYGLLLAPLLLFLAEEARRYRRRRLVLNRERKEKPPFVWPIHLPRALNPYERAESLPAAARQLRRREAAESLMRVDVERSIRATIDAQGYPTIRFVSITKPVEYLILVERTAPRDHQASLFGDLAMALDRESVPVTRFFFDGDPRVCYREPGEPGLLLSEVRRKYPGHRLLILGNGEGLIDPITGRVRSWVPALLSWPDRALLTTTPPGLWGMAEFELAGHFIVLPASVAALGEVRNLFDGVPVSPDGEEADPAPSGPHASAWRGEPQGVAQRLRQHLGEQDYQWLCACALYPELQWELTLYLGSIAGGSNSLVTEGSLLRLIRLPWFRTGVIPDALRVLLLKDLRPELAAAARSAIVGFLEHSPPPDTAMAADGYQLNLAVQRLALSASDRKRRQELLRAMERMPAAKVMQDRVLVQLLEDVPSTGVALLLPRRLRRVLFQHGTPAFGWSTAGRFAVAAAAMLAIGSYDVYRLWREREAAQRQRALAEAARDSASKPVTPPRDPEPPLVASAGLRIVRTGMTRFERGDTVRLTARGGESSRGRPVTWRSSTSPVIRVVDASRGMLIAAAVGEAVVEAVSGPDRDTMTVRVVEPVLTSLELRGPAVLTVGGETPLDVQPRSARGRSLPRPANMRFRSSRPDVAAIEPSTGVVSARAPGTAELEVTGGGRTSKLTVTVVEAAPVAADRWSPGLARVEIRAPNARLSVNGVAVSTSSWRADSMRPGDYVIVAAIDAPTECVSARMEVTERLTASDQVRTITLSPAACGTLVASGPPGAEYSLASRDGKTLRRGTLPLASPLVLPAGDYRMTAQMPQCTPFDGSASVSAGQTARLVIAFSCAESSPDAARFARDVVQPALSRYVRALSDGDTALVASLFRTTTRDEARARSDLLELLRRREVRLTATALSAVAAPGLTATAGEANFRIQLGWRDAFGRNRREAVTFRATFSGSGGEYQLTGCRVVGAPSLR